ncbi:MAG: PCRF domain-containing protein, partial [Acidimicrobiia bacterium]
MFDRLTDLEAELEALEERLPAIYASGDQAATREAGRRHRDLRPIVDAYQAWRRTGADVEEARELLRSEADADMRDYYKEEMAEKEQLLADLEGELKVLLLPRDPNDDKNVIVEVRGAE